MTLSEISALRLANQQLLTSTYENPVELVKWMGAVQSQDFAMAKWALALRLKKATDASVEAAIDAGGIIRTHILRPTWHFVATSDVRWMMELTAPHVNKLAGPMYRQLGLDDSIFKLTNDLIGRLLEDGQELTREEIIAEVNRAGVETDNLRATHIMFRAELDRIICNGARRGKKFTYALFDRKVPQSAPIPREEGLAALARRYFTSHGPATVQDFVWWSGLSVADAKLTLEIVRSEFETAKIHDREYLFAAFSELPKVHSKAMLVPPYDELTVGYADRSAAMDAAVAGNPDAGNGIFKPVVMVKGKIVAAWRRAEKKDAVDFEIKPFLKMPGTAEKSLEAAALAYARFVGKKNVRFSKAL